MQYIHSRSSLILFIYLHNELFSTEELLHHPKENIHTNLSQLYELMEGSSNTLYLLQEFLKSCFIKSVTSCNYLNYILLVISLCWGKFLNSSFMSRNGPQFNFVWNSWRSRTCPGIQVLKYPVKMIDQVTGQGKQHGKQIHASESVHLSQWFRHSKAFQNDSIMPWKKWMKT